MDQKPRFGTKFSVIQSQPAVTLQTTTTVASILPSTTTTYVMASNNSLRPVTNYTIVANQQVPVTQQYVVQSKARTTVPQYVSTNSARHVLSSGADGQPSNVTYMLPSGAHIVRMNNVMTTTVAGEQRPNTQYVLASGSQPSKANIATIVESNPGSSVTTSSRTLSQQTPIVQAAGVNISKLNTLNTAYYSQIKSNESAAKISFRPKLNDQTGGTNYILTSNDWPRGTKNVPITNLQKINTNFMQIPFIQKTGAVLAGNALKTNADVQQQSVRSVILPSNYNKNSDNKLVLNSVNIPTQIDHSNDKPSSVVQQLNTNYLQIPISQKPRTIINQSNSQLNTENIRGQQQQTIRSIILPSNYRTAMVSGPRKGADYKLVLKPVNLPPQMLRNLGPSRFISQRNSMPQNILSSARPTTVPLLRPPAANRVQSEVIANSKIVPIPQKNRKHHLVISKESVQICIDEINNRIPTNSASTLIVTEPAIDLITAEVTYRLFYLLRECKKVLVKSRSNVLTEDIMKQVCSEYFSTFYGNKLWPLFCLKPNEDTSDENRVWMRKHNNVNLVGWLQHPKFRNPSYIKKRPKKNLNNNNSPLNELFKVSEVLHEYVEPAENNQEIPQTEMHTSPESLQNDEILLNSLLSESNNDMLDEILQSFTDDQQLNQLLSIDNNELQTTVLESSNEPSLNPDSKTD